jgi:hypothetical protein
LTIPEKVPLDVPILKPPGSAEKPDELDAPRLGLVQALFLSLPPSGSAAPRHLALFEFW